MNPLWIKNGRVIDPAAKRDKAGDVFIADGKFVKTLTPAQKKAAQVIDARGRILMPGMFDAHVHFREPGQEAKETIATGAEAAINGGITGVVMMPNTSPAIDSGTVVGQVLDIARLLAAQTARPDIDGVVVVQGTDAIEETTFAFDLLLATDKPIVVTGAMRDASAPDYDGPRNLADAVRCAARGTSVSISTFRCWSRC